MPNPSRPNLSRLAAFALAVIPAGASNADAQIFTGTAANPSVTMPGTAPTPARVPVRPAGPAMRFLPGTADGLRLIGETGDLRWPVYLTAEQAKTTSRFRIGYLSAISVLPDSSSLEVRINERKVGTEVIDASSGLRTVEFTVPVGALEPGYNAVSLSLQQRHRVDCTVAATYELWTKIDPTETGFVLSPDSASIANIGDLPALLPRSDATLPIHILLSGKTNPAHLQRLIKTTQEIALAGHFQQPVIDFATAPDEIYGLDLALGTHAALGRLPQLADRIGTAGPLVKLVAGPAGGHPTLVVTGSTDAEVDQAIDQLGQSIDPQGTPAGLTALALDPATATAGNASIHLHDLGLRSQDFDGRRFRKSLDLRLPADFLASDYGRGTLDFAGGYAAGLARGSQVRVDVNGRSAGTIKLPYANGDVFQHNQLFLPLGLMQAGLNRIDIIAETPRPEDAVCAASDGRRFLLLDSSQLTLPVLAHVERLPDLGLTTAGALPYDRGIAHLVVPKPDRDTMAAALSLTARTAVTAGHVVAFRFSTTMPSDDDGSTLIVSPARQLDPALMTAVGLDPVAVETAWRGAAEMPLPARAGEGQALGDHWWMTSTEGPSACRLPSRLPPASAPASPPHAPTVAAAPVHADTDDLLEAWTAQTTDGLGWGRRLLSGMSNAVHWVANLSTDLHVPTWAHERPNGIAPGASLILAQGMSPGSSTNVTTIITAPDALGLRTSMACLFDPQVWPKVRGRLAVLDASNGDVTVTAATSFHYVASTSSIANSRLVIAGWFSLNPLAFAGVALLTALWLSGTTLWFVRNIGRKSE